MRWFRLAPARRRAQQLLVVVQVAFALVVVTGSCLMARSFLRLSRVDPGFAAPDVLTMRLALPAVDYPTDAAAARFFAAALARVRAVPGVLAAGVTSALPLAAESTGRTTTIEGLPGSEKAALPVIEFACVSDGYFSALGIPLLRGRAIDRLDAEHRTGAVVVDETLARRSGPRAPSAGTCGRVASARVPTPGTPWSEWPARCATAISPRSRRASLTMHCSPRTPGSGHSAR
ncbi:MAG TPA: hypothetical protein VHQ90_22820 [Thermoanaerobaculia bacterium]|nr:hypothetical protein [Thermoanaerobaculia bacterium]